MCTFSVKSGTAQRELKGYITRCNILNINMKKVEGGCTPT